MLLDAHLTKFTDHAKNIFRIFLIGTASRKHETLTFQSLEFYEEGIHKQLRHAVRNDWKIMGVNC